MSQTLPQVLAPAGRTASLIDRLFPPPRNFDVRLPDGTVLAGAAAPVFAMVLNHPGALRRMLAPPIELSMGEAYIHGDFDIEGDMFSAFSLIDASLTRKFSLGDIIALVRDVLMLPRSENSRSGGRGRARLRGALHSRERDRAAVQYHYDVGDDFYSLWLDRRLQYSCAYFPTGAEDLDTAQERKLDYICRKLRLRQGERLVDIGCGWGALVIYAAERYGVDATGITLSERQRALAQE